MTGPDDDEHPAPRSSSASRVDTAVALARMEAKLDVAIAQHGARLDTLDRTMTEVRSNQARLETRVGSLEQRAAATDERDRREDAGRSVGLSRGQLIATWTALAAATLTSIAGLAVSIAFR